MKISTNSWHYKFLNYVSSKPVEIVRPWKSRYTYEERQDTDGTWYREQIFSPPTNLCVYVRTFMMYFLFQLPLIIGFAALTGWLLILMPFVGLLTVLGFLPLDHDTLGGVGALIAEVIVGLILFFVINKDEISEKYQKFVGKSSVEEDKGSSTLAIIAQYIKDMHDKVCRQLEFTDK